MGEHVFVLDGFWGLWEQTFRFAESAVLAAHHLGVFYAVSLPALLHYRNIYTLSGFNPGIWRFCFLLL